MAYNQLLKDYILRLNKSQIGHFIAYEKYHKLNMFLTYSALIFSTLTTGLLLFDYFMVDDMFMRNITLVCSILALTISSIQSIAKFGDKAELHKNKASKYGSLKRLVEAESMSTDAVDKNFINDVRTQWDLIADDSPVTPKKYREEAKDVLRNDISDVEEFVKD